MNILITGTTGLAGSEVLQAALSDDSIAQVTAITRKPLEIRHPKLKVVIHSDFLDYSGLADMFKSHDACVWCLGIAQSLVSESEYHQITHDYTLAAAKAMLAANPKMAFMFLSGMGADSNEKSRTLFARVKGKTENALKQLSFTSLSIIRPGGIRPMQRRKSGAWYEQLLFPVYPILEFLFPSQIISARDLGKVMARILKEGPFNITIENPGLKRILKS